MNVPPSVFQFISGGAQTRESSVSVPELVVATGARFAIVPKHGGAILVEATRAESGTENVL